MNKKIFLDASFNTLKSFALSVGEKCKKVIEASPYVKKERTPVTISVTNLSEPNQLGEASFSVIVEFKFGSREYQRSELLSSISSSLSSIESYTKSASAFRSGEFKGIDVSFPLKLTAVSKTDCRLELLTVRLIVDKTLFESAHNASKGRVKNNDAFSAIKHLVWNFKSFAKDSFEQRWRKELGRIDPKLAADLSRYFAEGKVLHSRIEALQQRIKSALPRNSSI